MKKLTILIDIDSIVANLSDDWFGAYNKEYDDNLHMSKADLWHTHQIVKPECGKQIYDYITPELVRNLKPLDGAVETVNNLKEDGHRIVFVTAVFRPEENSNARVQWIMEHFPWATIYDFFIGGPKDLVKGDVFIDDAPHNLEAYRKAWPNALLLRIGYPYNEGAPGTSYGDHDHTEYAWNRFYADINTLAWLLS